MQKKKKKKKQLSYIMDIVSLKKEAARWDSYLRLGKILMSNKILH